MLNAKSEGRGPKGKTGVLLVNLGTPDAPEPKAVARYLREFLMDPLVVDIPFPLRWFLVNVIIAPRRSHTSAEAYSKVWTDRGSPLAFHHFDLAQGVARELGEEFVVVAGMRYGNPSIASAVAKLAEAGVDRTLVLPLFPQYSLAAYESAKAKVEEVLASPAFQGRLGQVETVPAFYDHPDFIRAFAEVVRGKGALDQWDHFLFSFHGVPERHVRKTDSTGSHCLAAQDCCERAAQAGVDSCYRAHCFRTAHLLAQELGIPRDRYTVGFQSRLGRTPWIQPFSDAFYRELPKKGIRRLAVLSPSFVADCLETIEEIGIRADEDFRASGGEKLTLIPSLNASPTWVRSVSEWARAFAGKAQ
jgi:ferrochelatase